MSGTAVSNLQLAPLGAGDLIDRTVRLYRRHFAVLVRTAAPPVVVSASGWILMMLGWRSMALTDSGGRLALYVLMVVCGIGVWFLGMLAQLVVMGGASRSLVMHLLRGEAVTTRLIYRGVRARFWSLLGASLAVFAYLALVTGVALVIFYIGVAIGGLGVVALFGAQTNAMTWTKWLPPVLFFLVVLVLTIIAVIWFFFFFAGRAAYVPQALMVEGKGVFAAISRSAQLARGNTRRLMAMFFFTLFAGYSALTLLLVPLGWIGYLFGVDPLGWDATRTPAWYAISSEVVGQLITILLAPVWMLGLSLLYVDERVRHEGYDIELLAAQRLGEIPDLPTGYRTPLEPALADPRAREPAPVAEEEKPLGSILGLSDHR